VDTAQVSLMSAAGDAPMSLQVSGAASNGFQYCFHVPRALSTGPAAGREGCFPAGVRPPARSRAAARTRCETTRHRPHRLVAVKVGHLRPAGDRRRAPRSSVGTSGHGCPSATDSVPRIAGDPAPSHQLRWGWSELFFRDSAGRSLRVDPDHRLTGGASRDRSHTAPLRVQLTYACVCALCCSRTGSPPMASNGHSSSACCTLAITYV
jgi:hypothetical protein